VIFGFVLGNREDVGFVGDVGLNAIDGDIKTSQQFSFFGSAPNHRCAVERGRVMLPSGCWRHFL